MAESALTPDQVRQLADLRRQAATDINSLTQEQLTLMRQLEDLERGIVDSSERRRKSIEDQIELLEEEAKLQKEIGKLGETVVGAYATQLEIERQSLEIKKLNLLAEEINEENLKNLLMNKRPYYKGTGLRFGKLCSSFLGNHKRTYE